MLVGRQFMSFQPKYRYVPQERSRDREPDKRAVDAIERQARGVRSATTCLVPEHPTSAVLHSRPYQ